MSLVERKLLEADRLEMCGMMWLKEHETCSPMDAVHSATRETVRQLNAQCFYVQKCFLFLYRLFDRSDCTNALTCKADTAAVKKMHRQAFVSQHLQNDYYDISTLQRFKHISGSSAFSK